MDFVSSSSYPGFWQALPCKHLLSDVKEHLLMQLLSAVMGSWKPLQLSEERISNGPGALEEQMRAHWLLTEDSGGSIGLPLSTPEKCSLGLPLLSMGKWMRSDSRRVPFERRPQFNR